MPSLKQRLRELEIERQEARRRQLTDFDAHRFLELMKDGKGEAEIARELHVDPSLVRQAATQLQPPPEPRRRGRRGKASATSRDGPQQK